MKYSALLVLCILLVCCSGSKVSTSQSTNAQDLQFVIDGSFNHEHESLANKRWVISSQSELESTFSMESNFIDYFKRNPFDFETYELLVATDVVRTTGGYSVNIQYDGEDKDTIFFKVKINSPEGMVTFPVLIPYQVKKFPKTNKSIKFRE